MKALRSQAKSMGAAKIGRLVGRKNGGRAPEPDADDKVSKAKKKPESAGPVDGAPAKMRLDRPGRRMKRADGGWTGEGDSGKALKEKAATSRDEGISDGRKGLIPAALGTAFAGASRGLTKKLGVGAALYGAAKMAQGFNRELEARKLDAEADKAEGRKGGGRVKR